MTTSRPKVLDRDFSIDFCVCGSTTNAHMFECVIAAHHQTIRKHNFSQMTIQAITVPCQMIASR
jgi:hypothetical protein